MGLNIVLVEPEIPQNTGNIARTCAATGSTLHIIRPMSFSVEDRYLKRAGLDYWHLLNIKYYDSVAELRELHAGTEFYFATTKAVKTYTEVAYPDECFIVFGKETAGLPEELLKQNKEYCIRIPMISDARSLNLSNSVAVIAFEILRQNGFKNLKLEENRLFGQGGSKND